MPTENELTKTAKPPKYYNLAEVEKFIEEYADWWEKFGKYLQPASTTDSGSNPGGTPPPPPGHNP